MDPGQRTSLHICGPRTEDKPSRLAPHSCWFPLLWQGVSSVSFCINSGPGSPLFCAVSEDPACLHLHPPSLPRTRSQANRSPSRPSHSCGSQICNAAHKAFADFSPPPHIPPLSVWSSSLAPLESLPLACTGVRSRLGKGWLEVLHHFTEEQAEARTGPVAHSSHTSLER